ncbi:MAG: oligoribonuclease [archaeon]
MTDAAQRLIWIDLEMTGLDTRRDAIIEIATIVTDGDLEILAEGPVLAINQPEQVMESMDDWNTRQHGQSGLTRRVLESTIGYASAEARTLEFLQDWVAAGESPMCGNSICQDRRFLARLMPDLEAYFHYRNLDVSSVKELIRRWSPSLLEGVSKEGSHLALDDICDSIAELRYYREYAFRI